MTGALRVTVAAPGFDDWRAVLTLLREAYAYMDGRIDPPSSLTRMDASALAAFAAAGDLILAHDGGQLVGCAFCTPKNDVLYIGKVATAASHRGRGVARAMMDEAAARARARGLKALELQARVELAEVHAAYAAMGFEKVGETAHPGYDRPTSITMRRPMEVS